MKKKRNIKRVHHDTFGASSSNPYEGGNDSISVYQSDPSDKKKISQKQNKKSKLKRFTHSSHDNLSPNDSTAQMVVGVSKGN